MAVRDDVSVEFYLSPRVIRVAAPSTQITIQDLHDTLRDIEDEPGNMQYPDLIRTAGGETLSGGTSVGLTATLRNARLAFDARKSSISSGTVTTGDATGYRLIDAAATFQSDGVLPGMWVVNLSDGSICSVVVVESETSIVTDVLGDGVIDQWVIGDSYKIWPVVQAEVLGGNLVAVDENSSAIEAILPTAGTQVVRTSSSSATLTEQQGQVVATALTVPGSTDSVIRTNIAAPVNFYNGMLVQIIDGAQSVVRRIDYQAGDGTLYPTTSLPFTPSSGATIIILPNHLAINGTAG